MVRNIYSLLMTAPTELDPVEQLRAETIGDAWVASAAAIMQAGVESTYDNLPMRELIMWALRIEKPSSDDDLIARYADPVRLAWMHANFTDHAAVTALGNADSYATRLRDYARQGRDQIGWVSERLRNDPLSRSATISTLQPLTDTSYVPCVSLLDFFLTDAGLNLTAYCHSIDFGAKGYGNLVELAALQEEVAENVGQHVGTLTMIVKSAHVYATDYVYMRQVLSACHGEPPAMNATMTL